MNWKNLVMVAVLLLFVSSISAVAEVNGKDLAVMSYSVMPKPAVIDEQVEVTLKIKNDGTEAITESFQVEFQVCQPGGFYCHIAEGETVDGLTVGEEKSFLKYLDIKESDVLNGKSLIRFIVDGDADVEEVDEINNIYGMVIEVVEEAPVEIVEEEVTEEDEEVFLGNPVTFSVSVNDYPNHGDKNKIKKIVNGYVNMYTVKLIGQNFKVMSTETKFTGNDGMAEFIIQPGQMVYFEGFITKGGAANGANAKESLLWTAPPFKNFGYDKICQTNFHETSEYLKYSQDYACADTLSTPYKDVGKFVTVPNEIVEEQEVVEILPAEDNHDLSVSSVVYGNSGFKATICNTGATDLSGFKVRFTAHDKDNVLTYAPTLAKGNCVTLTSWSYSYFGVEKADFVEVVVMVDPLNEIVEFNENNNELETAGTKPMLPAYDETKQEDKPMLPAYDETKQKPMLPAYEEGECLNGCDFQGKCLPIGTKIKPGRDALFCSWDKEMVPQLVDGEFCQNDYECESNSCISSECIDLGKQLEEQQNLLNKILEWLEKFF